MKKTFTIKISVDVNKDKKNTIVIRDNVNWTLGMIKNRLLDEKTSQEDRKYFLKEYEKFYLMSLAGVKVYPLAE